jgi:hypothetical protein
MNNYFELRHRFKYNIRANWLQNDHNLKEISCVYAILGFDYNSKDYDIFYIGSTTSLNSRYKSHKIPDKIQKLGLINILYYLPMDKGFYDYEIKLIRKLKPLFNKQHKNGA